MYPVAELTCRIASLCSSAPLHEGIKSFKTPNSSFILLLLLRSIILCAVFLATLRPAAVLAVPVFFFLAPLAGLEVFVALLGGTYAASSLRSSSCTGDAIGILLHDRDGRGGSEKSDGSVPVEGCLEALIDSGEASECGETGFS